MLKYLSLSSRLISQLQSVHCLRFLEEIKRRIGVLARGFGVPAGRIGVPAGRIGVSARGVGVSASRKISLNKPKWRYDMAEMSHHIFMISTCFSDVISVWFTLSHIYSVV